MIYHLAGYLEQFWSVFHVVHYVSFRAMAALLSTLFFSFMLGNWFLEQSQHYFRSQAREYTPENHKKKHNLPTMGGIFIVFITALNTLLWCNLSQPLVWIILLCLISFGIIGGIDDWGKIRYKKGIFAKTKALAQFLIALTISLLWIFWCQPSTAITIPFFKWWYPELGLLFIPWCILVIIASSNGVNLTDGLDGLAINCLIPNFATFGVIAYLAGHYAIASYLFIPYAGSAEISVIAAILVGASLGFLWYNTYPAQIFMGDVGSLALGATLGLIALMTKQELLLLITGAIFVFETMSVILQVASFKFRGTRLFKMAPIHHHFELLGWQEPKITVRFGIISLILCLIALMTLKIR